ncbi:hypothetical protein [Clostridium butyricum]|uniref:hypothetical protein n=1 Tax=Clostridium butyricum TaxID=1492 RepID=UPI00374EFFA8
MKYSEKEVKEFVENLFKNSSSELKDLYKHQYSIESDIKDEIQRIMYIYTIENDVMNMSRAEQQKEIKKLDKMIDDFYKADAEMQIEILYKLLEGTTTEVFRFYSYNADKKEITDIVKQTYKGRHFSQNVWNDETETAKYMKKQLFDFIKGKVNVNQITKGVEKLFGNTHYESRRLAETEVARCQSAAFDRFASEVGVEKVKYRATLCNTCDKCKADDGKPFDFDKKIKLPRHPFCQCYYDIIDGEESKKILNMDLQLFGVDNWKMLEQKIQSGQIDNEKFEMCYNEFNKTFKNGVQTPLENIKCVEHTFVHIAQRHPDMVDLNEIMNIKQVLEKPNYIYETQDRNNFKARGYIGNIKDDILLIISRGDIITAYYPNYNYLKKNILDGGKLIWENK